MLLHNLDPSKGLYNGTHVIFVNIYPPCTGVTGTPLVGMEYLQESMS